MTPFTTAQARSAGITDAILRGPRYRQLFRGVHLASDVEPDLDTWVTGARLVLPRDAVVSHQTALRLWGFDTGSLLPLHFSTNTSTRSRQRGVTVHRRKHRLWPVERGGHLVTGPDRTLVDVATKLDLVRLIQAIEHFLHHGWTTIDTLGEYALTRHLDGVQRMRRILAWVRTGVESPAETWLRLLLVLARLPEPLCNVDLLDEDGGFLARGDLVYPEAKVLVEYDGWYHERDAEQRRRDTLRRERLEAAGWRVIVVTIGDVRDPRLVVHRVHQALTARGYRGPRPAFSVMWDRWFASRPRDVAS